MRVWSHADFPFPLPPGHKYPLAKYALLRDHEIAEVHVVDIPGPISWEALLRVHDAAFVQRMRTLDLFKAPGIAETIDWINALVALDAMSLAPENVRDTLGVLLKHRDDIARMQGGDIAKLLAELPAQPMSQPSPNAA